MTRAGRKPMGPQLVDRLEGSPEARARLKAILKAMTGERTIPELCTELGIKKSRFHELQFEALDGAMASLEPRPAGRPRQAVDTSGLTTRVAELEAENQQLRNALFAAEVREQLAQTMPHVLHPETTAAASPKSERLRRRARRRTRKPR